MTAEDYNQTKPLAPATIYGRSDDVEAAFPFAPPRPKRHKTSSKCLAYFLLLLTILLVLVFIFTSVALRAAAPKVKLSSVTVETLSILTGAAAPINGTLVAEINIDNNNNFFGYFGYEDSSIAFLYGDVTLGDTKIDGGRVSARKTETVYVPVELRSTFALAGQDKNFTGDVSIGVVELRSFAQLTGKVHIRQFEWSWTHLMKCTMNLVLSSQEIQDLACL